MAMETEISAAHWLVKGLWWSAIDLPTAWQASPDNGTTGCSLRNFSPSVEWSADECWYITGDDNQHHMQYFVIYGSARPCGHVYNNSHYNQVHWVQVHRLNNWGMGSPNISRLFLM